MRNPRAILAGAPPEVASRKGANPSNRAGTRFDNPGNYPRLGVAVISRSAPFNPEGRSLFFIPTHRQPGFAKALETEASRRGISKEKLVLTMSQQGFFGRTPSTVDSAGMAHLLQSDSTAVGTLAATTHGLPPAQPELIYFGG